MANCSLSHPWNPMVCTCVASAGVGPKAACSRKRRAAEGETSGLGTPTFTGKGWDVTDPLATVRLSGPPVPAKPATVNDVGNVLAVTGTVRPPSWTTDFAANPVPVIVAEKTPRGNGLAE